MSLYTEAPLPRYCKTCAKPSVFASAADGGDILLQYKKREKTDDAWDIALENQKSGFWDMNPAPDDQSISNVQQLQMDFKDIIGKSEACTTRCKQKLQTHVKGEKRKGIEERLSGKAGLENQMVALKSFNVEEKAQTTVKMIQDIEGIKHQRRNDIIKTQGKLWWLSRKVKVENVSQNIQIIKDKRDLGKVLLTGLEQIERELVGSDDGKGPEVPGGSGDGKGSVTTGGDGGGKGPATPAGREGGGKGTAGSVTNKRFVVNFVGPRKKQTLTSQGNTDLKLPEGVDDYKRLHLNSDKTIGYADIAAMHDEFIKDQLKDQYTLYNKKGNPIPTYNREQEQKSWAHEPEDLFVIKNDDEELLGLCVAYSFSVACQSSQFKGFLSKTGLKKTLYIDKWYAEPGNGMPLLKTVIQTQTFLCDRVMATTLQKNSAAMCKFLFMPDTPFNFCFHRDVEQLIALAQINNDQANPAALVQNKYKFHITDNEEIFTLAQYVLFQLASTMTPANNDTTLEHVLESSEITDHPLQKKFEDLDKFAAWCKQIPDINDPLATDEAVMKKFKSIDYLDDFEDNMALDLNALLKRQRFDFLTKVIRQIEHGFVFLKTKPRNEANEQKLKNLQTQVIEQMKTQYDLVLGPDRDEFVEAEIKSMKATLKNEGILDNDKSNWFARWKELKDYVDDKIKQPGTDKTPQKSSTPSAAVEITPTPQKPNSWAAGVASGVVSGVAGVIGMFPKRDKAADKPEPEKPEPEKPEPEKPEPEKPAAPELKTERYYEKAPKEDGSLEQDTEYVSLEIRVDAHVVEKTAVQEAITSAINQMTAEAPDTKIISLYVRISTGNAAMIRTMIGEKFHTVDDPNVPFRVSTCPAWMVNYQALWDANVKYYDACKDSNDDDKLSVKDMLDKNKSLVEGLADMNSVLPKEDTKTFIWLQCPASKENALGAAEDKNILVYLDRLTALQKTWKFSGSKKAKNFVVFIDKKEVKGRRTSSIEFEGKVASDQQKKSLSNVQGQVCKVFLQEFQHASEQEGEGRKKMYIKDIIDSLKK